MGRMNNNRARRRAAEESSRPTRARFSNWKPPQKDKKNTKGKGNKYNNNENNAHKGNKFNAAKKGRRPASVALVQKLQQASERKRHGLGTESLKPINQHMLRGVKISELESVELSLQQQNLIVQILRELGVVENIDADESGTKKNLDRASTKQQLVSSTQYCNSAVPPDLPAPPSFSVPIRSSTPEPPDPPIGDTDAISLEGLMPLDKKGDSNLLTDTSETSKDDLPETKKSSVFMYITSNLSFSADQAILAMRSTGYQRYSPQESGMALNAALDWLCLHLSQDELKKGFITQVPQTASVRKMFTQPKESEQDGSQDFKRTIRGVGEMEIAQKADWLFESRCLAICQLGFSSEEAAQALHTIPKLLDNDGFEAEFHLNDDLLSQLLSHSQPTAFREELLSSDELSEMVEEELMVLESIFLEDLHRVHDRRLEIKIDLGFTPPASPETKLHVLLPEEYPNQTPVVWIENQTLAPGLIRLLLHSLGKELKTMVNDGVMVYSVVTWLQENAVEQQRYFKDTTEEKERKAGEPIDAKQSDSEEVESTQLKKRPSLDENVYEESLKQTTQHYISRHLEKANKEFYEKEAQALGEQAFLNCVNGGGTLEEAKAAMAQARKDYLGEEDQSSSQEDTDQNEDCKDIEGNDPGPLGVALLEEYAMEVSEKLEVGMPVARSLISQVLSPKFKRHGKNSRKKGPQSKQKDHQLTKEEVLIEAINLHFQKQESKEKRLAAITGPKHQLEQNLECEAETLQMPLSVSCFADKEVIDGEGLDSDHVSKAASEAKNSGPLSGEFKPSPYLVEIMKCVTDTIKQQPWLIKHQETETAPLQSSLDIADLMQNNSEEMLQNEKKVSSQMQRDMDRKRANPKYQEMLRVRSQLPAYQMRAEIVLAIQMNQVVVISGETGCGKTTQVPQLILDHLIDQNEGAKANILVTQPRRISAIGVSERIAQERVERVGQTSGYQIRLESKRSSKTRLLLCTTGVLLRRLQCDRALASVSHVFVDEVHERDLNTDFLLIILRDLLPQRPKLKLVLMSATLNASTFAGYFQRQGLPPVPIVSIPGRAHPVQAFFLEDVLESTNYQVDPRGDFAVTGKMKVPPGTEPPEPRTLKTLQRILPNYSEGTLQSLKIVDENLINYEMIESLLLLICETKPPGAILVFMPGLMEITKLIERLNTHPVFSNRSRVVLYALHSSLSTEEQTKIFEVPPDGVRKIVVSTNIAETSITIEDVVYVVDTGRVKENRYDDINMMPMLVECWESLASARQRRGRAGRVRPGMCFHLFSSATRHENQIAEFQLPEMLRTSLDDLILQILLLDLGDPTEFLDRAVNPPSKVMMSNSISHLTGLQAIELDGKDNTQLTALGYHLATLPVEPKIGKMLVYGTIFSCVDPVLTIAASMCSRNPFTAPFEKREEADLAKRRIAFTNSDHLTLFQAYNLWQEARRQGWAQERAFLRENFLSRNTLQMISQMRTQFLDMLKDIGFVEKVNRKEMTTDPSNSNSSNIQLVRAVICAGLYPNVLVAPTHLVNPDGNKQKDQNKIGDHALMSTKGAVYVHPMSINFDASKLDTRYIVYHEVVKTSKVYIRDGTTVSPFILILFGGDITVHHEKEVITLDSWLHFKAARKTATLMKHLRLQLERLLLQKITNPDEDISASGKKLVQALDSLLESRHNYYPLKYIRNNQLSKLSSKNFQPVQKDSNAHKNSTSQNKSKESRNNTTSIKRGTHESRRQKVNQKQSKTIQQQPSSSDQNNQRHSSKNKKEYQQIRRRNK